MTAAVGTRDGSDWRWAAALHLAVGAVLVVVVWQSSVHLTRQEEGRYPRAITLEHGDDVLGPWLYWDTKYYVDISEHGYRAEDRAVFEAGGETAVAFFPGYPLVVAALGVLGVSTGFALVGVTLLAGLGATVVLHKLFTLQMSRAASRRATLALALFPWSYFLIATAYPEALFLFLAGAAFLLVEHDRPVAAGLLAALASATRLIGIGLVLGLAIRVAERRGALTFDGWRPRVDRSRLRRRDAGVLFGASGLAAWMVVCWVRYGDPLAFSTAQRGWSQGFGPRSWFKLGLIDQLQHNQERFFVTRLVLQGLVMLLFAIALPAVWRRFGAGYGTYSVVVVMLPLLGSANFASHGRFALMAFPVFGLLGVRLERERAPGDVVVLALSGAALVVVASLWGRGYWMA